MGSCKHFPHCVKVSSERDAKSGCTKNRKRERGTSFMMIKIVPLQLLHQTKQINEIKANISRKAYYCIGKKRL
jgi:hypothetical protein